jgi:hypothetical protein
MKMLPFRMGVCAAVAFLVFGASAAAAWRSQPDLEIRNAVPATSPRAAVLYTQPSDPAGGLLLSSLRDPNGSDVDQWIWDAFTLSSTQDITEIHWSGGHDPARLGSGGPVANFTVSIYASNAPSTQPDLPNPPLIRHEVGGNAGETPGQTLGGVQMYNYVFVLPAAFRAVGGTKYWVQIEAYQPGPTPDWGLTKGTGGDQLHFRYVAGEGRYQTLTGDTTFELLGPGLGVSIYLPCIYR